MARQRLGIADQFREYDLPGLALGDRLPGLGVNALDGGNVVGDVERADAGRFPASGHASVRPSPSITSATPSRCFIVKLVASTAAPAPRTRSPNAVRTLPDRCPSPAPPRTGARCGRRRGNTPGLGSAIACSSCGCPTARRGAVSGRAGGQLRRRPPGRAVRRSGRAVEDLARRRGPVAIEPVDHQPPVALRDDALAAAPQGARRRERPIHVSRGLMYSPDGGWSASSASSSARVQNGSFGRSSTPATSFGSMPASSASVAGTASSRRRSHHRAQALVLDHSQPVPRHRQRRGIA